MPPTDTADQPLTLPDLTRAIAKHAARITQATHDRDRLIITAHQAGLSLRAIAEPAQLTHAGVANIIRRQTPTP